MSNQYLPSTDSSNPSHALSFYEPSQDISLAIIGISQNKTSQVPIFQKGRWSQQQNQKYIKFLKKHSASFNQIQIRRRLKIFSLCSKFLGSRSAGQCRSHHQKMIKRFHSTSQIIKYHSKQNIPVVKIEENVGSQNLYNIFKSCSNNKIVAKNCSSTNQSNILVHEDQRCQNLVEQPLQPHIKFDNFLDDSAELQNEWKNVDWFLGLDECYRWRLEDII